MSLDGGNRRIRDEMDHHLAELVAQLVAQGMDEEEARAEARRRFGNPERIERAARAAGAPTPRGLSTGLRGDLLQMVRGLRRAPAFTGAISVTLALALGATVSVVAVVWDVLLRPLDLRDPSALVRLVERPPDGGPAASPTSEGTFHDWRRGLATVEGVEAWEWVNRTLEDPERSEELIGLQVSGGLLELLGVRAELGRVLTPADEVIGAPSRSVMIGHDLWVGRFGRDPDIVGRSIQIDGTPREIVGVAPSRLDFVEPGALIFDPSPHLPADETNRGGRVLHVVARLAPGRTARDASAEVAALTERIAETYPVSARGWSAAARPIAEYMLGDARPRLLAVAAGVGLLLLVATINVANLLLVRSADGRREMAVREALGAGRARIVRMRLLEGTLIGLLGGAGGLLLASRLHGWLAATHAGSLPRSLSEGLPAPAAAFGLGLALVVGLAVGAIPALRGSGTALAALARGTAGARGGASLGTRRTFLVLQLGVTTVLLVGGGLLVRTVGALNDVELGFDAGGVIAARTSLDPARYPSTESQRVYYEGLLDRVRAIPGVEAAGLTSALPMDPVAANFDLPTRTDPAVAWSEAPQVDFRLVGTGLADALGLRLLEGRFLEERDTDGPRVAVVNRSLAEAFWPGESALGKPIQPVWYQGGPAEVVGVVEDTRFYGPRERTRPEVLVPYARFGWNLMTLVVRGSVDPSVLRGEVERTMVDLDPLQPPTAVFPVANLVEATTAVERLNATLLSGFAVLALVLAAAGVYGLLAYSVRLRSREMGLRIALGATPDQVTGMVLRGGVALALLGVALGLGAALPTARLLEGMLFGVEPVDPLTLGGVALLLLAVAGAACLSPALRAARMDPARTLTDN